MRTGILMPGLLSIALVAILFRLPQPAIQVNQPFKVELLLSLFLAAFFVLIPRERRAEYRWRKDNTLMVAIAAAIGSFVLWSLASFAWGASFGSVAHHTLLWSVYLLFFLIFTGTIWPAANFRFVAHTFSFVALILGILCVFDYLTVVDFTSSEGDIRIRYGKYAELLVMISPLLWAVAIYTKSIRQKLVMLLIAILSWTTVMLSLSKGAFIAGMIGFAIFFVGAAFFTGKRSRKRILAFAGIWLAVTIGTQVFFSFFSAVPSTTNYITGAADQTRSTTAMRVFTWSVARQMIADHSLTGVGADNFGLTFNAERAAYRATHPDDPKDEIAEDYIVERAHNETLQVLAELGVVGIVLFSLPLLIFGYYFVKTQIFRRRMSPVLCAAAAGMAAFLVSSQVSSFSFRSAQNGVAFFMIFAVGVCEIGKTLRRVNTTGPRRASLRPVILASWIVVLLLTAFCLSKVVAEYHLYRAERTPVDTSAVEHYRAAVAVDPEYAGAYLSYAARVAKDDPANAADLTRKAIDHGVGISAVYSQLAKRQMAASNAAGAEATFREALSIYPRSLFLRTEFVVFLEDQGRSADAAEQAAIARAIDPKHADGWYMLIRDGSVATFYRAQKDKNIAPPVELTPSNGVLQYLDKTPSAAEAEPEPTR